MTWDAGAGVLEDEALMIRHSRLPVPERPRQQSRPSCRATRAVVVLSMFLLIGAPVPEPAAGTSPPMNLGEIVSLLKAGLGEKVILRQVHATGTRLVMTVDSLMALKAAGASDAFIEALMTDADAAPVGHEPAGEPAGGGPSPVPPNPGPRDAGKGAGTGRDHRDEPPIRIFMMEDDRGQRIVHITNLDENGRRIGGELPDDPPASRNVIAEGEAAPPVMPLHGAGQAGERPPVVVNVYPPAPAEEAEPVTVGFAPPPVSSHIVDPYNAFIPVVGAPGYSGYGYGYNPEVLPPWGRPGGPYYGRPYGYGGVVYSPPGSYTHFIRYHRPAGAHRFKRYPGYTIYHNQPNAAGRNRVYFQNR